MILSLLLWGTVLLTVLFVVFMFVKFRQQKKHFEDHGVPYLRTGFIQLVRLLAGRSSLAEMELVIYKDATSHTNAKFIGISDFLALPGVYITDLDLIRNVYVKDFDHFVNRRPVNTQQSNLYFKKMLFAMESEQWKGIRAKLSPSFTTGKIRRMFAIFRKNSENMSSYVLREVGPSGSDFDFGTAFPKYAMDAIASCAFGIDSKCFDVRRGEISTFEDMGRQFQFDFKPKMFFKFLVMTIAPKVADALKLEAMNTVPQDYFSSVIRQVIKHRRQTGQRCEDFLQLMMDAQQGLLKGDEDTNEVMNGTTDGETTVLNDVVEKKVTFDDDDIIANCLLFMLGGFDTTQSLLLFTVYQLALEPEVQQKLFDEVKAKIEENGGMLTYEGVQEMQYMDLVLNETLRFYPPASRTERVCTKDYKMPGSNYLVKKGAVVGIPIYPVHHDPKYFEDPKKFIPERFLPENKANRHPYAFMPFGHGPRNCIGMRFALTEVKAVIAQIVYSFKLEPCTKTLIPIKFDTNSNLKPKGGMWLRVIPRN